MKERLSHQILKKLVFEYRRTKDEKTFLKILSRIDNLVVYVVHKYYVRRPQFRNIDLQSFYQSAIVGVYKGINSAKESETGLKLQARLIAYMKAEMRIYSTKDREKDIASIALRCKDTHTSEESVYHDLEQEFLRQRYSKFIRGGIITSEEFEILVMRYADSTKVKNIAEYYKHSTNWVRRRIRSSLERIRGYLRRNKLEDV